MLSDGSKAPSAPPGPTCAPLWRMPPGPALVSDCCECPARLCFASIETSRDARRWTTGGACRPDLLNVLEAAEAGERLASGARTPT